MIVCRCFAPTAVELGHFNDFNPEVPVEKEVVVVWLVVGDLGGEERKAVKIRKAKRPDFRKGQSEQVEYILSF